MNVLVLGASGFIGLSIVAALERAGHRARCVARDAERLRRRLPGREVHRLDLLAPAARQPAHWAPLLEGVHGVVNAAGVLQPAARSRAWAVHHLAPDALYEACERANVRRVIHISALGVQASQTTFARSKRAGEQCLMQRGLDWTVLRPAVVIGDDSYGGTSLLRALAAFPFVTPILGDRAIPISFIHKEDLARGIVRLIDDASALRQVLYPAGSETLTLLDALRKLQAWLALPPKRAVRIPLPVARAIARAGDLIRAHPITSTALAQVLSRLSADGTPFERSAGITARGLSATLAARAAGTQDLWHARLFLVRPLVRLVLALLWAASGLTGLLAERETFEALGAPLAAPWAAPAITVASIADLAIALALLLRWHPKPMAWVQGAVILAYTAALGALAPHLWSEPMAALIKNIPILALVLIHAILEEER